LRFCRFTTEDGPARWGIVESSAVVAVEGDVFSRYGASSEIFPREEVTLLAPVQPSKIIALGTNFRLHAEEMGRPLPEQPKIFFKPPSALIGHGAAIRLPDVEGNVDFEAEVALVIGKRCRHVESSQALDCVFGYTCFNDVTARALQRMDGVFARAKGFDTFAPAGPWIETDALWEDLELHGRVNGETRQSAALGDLIFGVPEVIAFVSSIMTLEPGDVIATGTPAGVGLLSHGDLVEVTIDGIGTLRNHVR